MNSVFILSSNFSEEILPPLKIKPQENVLKHKCEQYHINAKLIQRIQFEN